MTCGDKVGLLLAGIVLLALTASQVGADAPTAASQTTLEPRILSSELYPCSQCHADFVVETAGPTSDFHDMSITGHGEPVRGCLDCHARDDLDSLRLVSGEPIDFVDVDTLCGQCHGKIYLAWQAGAYGKRTGSWNGAKRLFSCSECHDPHQPAFAAIVPDPAPMRPSETLGRRRR